MYIIDYRVPRPPTLGDFVVFKFPDTGFGVGPRPGMRTIKRVEALPGDRVRVEGTELYIRHMHIDRLWLAKSIPGKDVGSFDADYIVPDGKIFVYGTEKESFDSRYFGPISVESVIGYARPVF